METLNDKFQLDIRFKECSNNNLTQIQKNKIYNIYKIDFRNLFYNLI